MELAMVSLTFVVDTGGERECVEIGSCDRAWRPVSAQDAGFLISLRERHPLRVAEAVLGRNSAEISALFAPSDLIKIS